MSLPRLRIEDQFAQAVEPDPAVLPGMACSECERSYGLSHLDTCSHSLMHGGECGTVGFRRIVGFRRAVS